MLTLIDNYDYNFDCYGRILTKHVVVGYLLNKINISNVNGFCVAFFNQKPLPDIVYFSSLILSHHTSLPSALSRNGCLVISLPKSADFIRIPDQGHRLPTSVTEKRLMIGGLVTKGQNDWCSTLRRLIGFVTFFSNTPLCMGTQVTLASHKGVCTWRVLLSVQQFVAKAR